MLFRSLAGRFGTVDFGIKDLIAVLGPAIEAGGAKPPPDLGALMIEAGLANVVGPIGDFLAFALGGAASREQPAALEKTTPGPG